MTVRTRREESVKPDTAPEPQAEATEAPATEPQGEAEAEALVSDTGDEFAGIEVIEVDKAPAAVTPLDKIPASIRQYVAQATGTGKPLLIPVRGWDKAKRDKFARHAKAVTPYLPDGKKVSVKPGLHQGQEVLTLLVYKPTVRKSAANVPPVTA